MTVRQAAVSALPDDVVQSLDLTIVLGERCPVTHTFGFEVAAPHLDVVSVALSQPVRAIARAVADTRVAHHLRVGPTTTLTVTHISQNGIASRVTRSVSSMSAEGSWGVQNSGLPGPAVLG
jgi:hypothetical protein